VAGWRQRRGAPAARGPGDPRARGGVARGRAEAARGRRSGGHGARDGVPPTAALEGEGKELGEDEGASGKLTVTFNRTAEGRRRIVDERAELRRGNNGGRGGREADSAGERVGRLGEVALEVRGEARRVGVRGIEKGRRAWPA
jgi:hypothetical protein